MEVKIINTQIRQKAKESKVFLYEVAEFMGISESTMTRKLRRNLSLKEEKEFMDIINLIYEIKIAKGDI